MQISKVESSTDSPTSAGPHTTLVYKSSVNPVIYDVSAAQEMPPGYT